MRSNPPPSNTEDCAETPSCAAKSSRQDSRTNLGNKRMGHDRRPPYPPRAPGVTWRRASWRPERLGFALLVRLHKPEPFVDAAGNLGQDVSAVGVLELVHLLDAH